MFSTAIQAWKFASKAYAKDGKKYCRNRQYKSLAYTLIYPVFAAKWFKALYSPEFKIIAEQKPRLYYKPFRVYMSTKWDIERKAKVILDTYQFIRNNGEGFMQLITSEKPVPLVIFKLKDGSDAMVTLGYDERYRKEGELIFFLHSEKLGGFITGAAFSFENISKEGWGCRIGSIQGPKDGKENIIKEAQNLMNGLRPKSLMVFTIQEFARDLGVQTVYGAGQAIQAFRRKHAIHIQCLHKIYFDYNKLWTESGGIMQKDGWFLLPPAFPRKDMETIKACKRASYRRRYAMMDEISLEIFKSVQQSKRQNNLT